MPATIEAYGRPGRPALLCCLENRLQGANLSVQTALISRCLVLVYQAFSGHGIEYRNRGGVGVRRGSFVTRVYRCDNTLNMSTHHRTHAGVAGTSCFRLTSTFLRLGGVCQLFLLGKVVNGKLKIQPSSIVRGSVFVNRPATCSARDFAEQHTALQSNARETA